MLYQIYVMVRITVMAGRPDGRAVLWLCYWHRKSYLPGRLAVMMMVMINIIQRRIITEVSFGYVTSIGKGYVSESPSTSPVGSPHQKVFFY